MSEVFHTAHVKRVRSVQCVAGYKRLEFRHIAHVIHVSNSSANALEIDQ